MNFHIIYTPESTKYLVHFILSLSKCSSFQFHLVSNGCSIEARMILKNQIAQHQKFNYYTFPTNSPQIHGRVLTHLQARCHKKYFCFMDSDIFATAPLPNLIEMMERENLTALFSAMPLWVKKPEYVFKSNFKNLVGTFNQAENGDCLGSTYFAIYRNEHLEQIMQHYGACFDECNRSELSPQIQKALSDMGYRQQSFDTGKVINLLLLKHGFKLKNIELSQLCHIGGTSYETTYRSQPLTVQQKIKNILLSSPLCFPTKSYLSFRKKRAFKKRYRHAPSKELQINYNQRMLHRNPTRQHFLKLFLALSQGEAVPAPPVFVDEEITTNVQRAHHAYIINFRQYYDLN